MMSLRNNSARLDNKSRIRPAIIEIHRETKVPVLMFSWQVIVYAPKLALIFSFTVVFSATAWAQSTPMDQTHHNGWGQESGKSVEEIHKIRCSDHYAHRIGKLAELEAKLDLTDKQKGLWAQWRKIKVESLADERQSCLQITVKPDARPTVLVRETQMERRLTAKLHDIQSARPALQALYDSLSPEQKAVMDRQDGSFGHRHRDWAHHRIE